MALVFVAQRRGEALAAAAVPFLRDAGENEGLRVVQGPGPKGGGTRDPFLGGVRPDARSNDDCNYQHFPLSLDKWPTDRRIALMIEDGSSGDQRSQKTARRGPKKTIEDN